MNKSSFPEQKFIGDLLKITIREIDEIHKNEVLKKNEGFFFPLTINKKGELELVTSKNWTCGFFPGTLWYMYEWTKDTFWLENARRYTALIEMEKLNATTHDVGFKIFCSFGNGYRLTGDEAYREIMIETANTLITRFNKKVGCIRSWDNNHRQWDFPVIIDNMMNLELLFWATKATDDSTYYNIAVSHAYTTLREHFRADGSSYHVIDFNPETGEVQNRHTHQGYSHESSWARGQAWGLYGFTMAYRETGITEFLTQAEIIAKFILNHPNLPKDLVPYWDFNAPEIPNEPRDASAAAIMASALFELSSCLPEKSNYYRVIANRIHESLIRNYLSVFGENKGFLLKQSVGNKPRIIQVGVPLVYADYYFVEALIRNIRASYLY